MADKAEKRILRFHLRDVRLAFPNLDSPGKFGYGARFLLPPDHTQTLNPMSREYLEDLGIKPPADLNARIKTVLLFEKIALAVARKKWGAKGDAAVKALKLQDKLFFHDGSSKAELDGFEGNIFVASGSRGPVPMFDQVRNEATAREVYSGAYVVASLDFWAQDNAEGGKRINSSVYGVQKLKDGDAFASGGPPADAGEFDEIGIDEDAGAEGGEEGPGEDDDLTA
jgi:hypothetical protein